LYRYSEGACVGIGDAFPCGRRPANRGGDADADDVEALDGAPDDDGDDDDSDDEYDDGNELGSEDEDEDEDEDDDFDGITVVGLYTLHPAYQ
jgi:hypothetical protein